MEFGIFLEWPNSGSRPWRDAFEEGIEQVQLAERLGFSFCLIAEHHFSDYGVAPAPILEALAILRATSTIRVGTGVAVLPTWQPLRLAEEIAVADQLSGGRFIAGVGRGFVPFEQQRFGVEVDESRARFDESLEVLIKAWTESDFTYEGRFVSVPRPTTVLPRPLQQPHPPLWLAGVSEESREHVGRLGMTPIISASLGAETISQLRTALEEARARHGNAAPLEMVAQAHAFAGETREEVASVLTAARWQRRAVPSLLAERVAGGVLDVVPLANEPTDEQLLEAQLFGTPGDLVSRIAPLEAAGVTHLNLLTTFGGLAHEHVLRSIRLLGEAVLPSFRTPQG